MDDSIKPDDGTVGGTGSDAADITKDKKRCNPFDEATSTHSKRQKPSLDAASGVDDGDQRQTSDLFSEESDEYVKQLNRELALLTAKLSQPSPATTPRKKKTRVAAEISPAKAKVTKKAKGSTPVKCETEPDIPPDEVEKLDKEINEVLEEKIEKNNLSNINVKHILRYVITNEHVLAMVRNTMREDACDGAETAEEVPYEPKHTRSKTKELIEKKEHVPWPISPIKKPGPPPPKLMETEFCDDESSSDEEYDPKHEVLNQSEDDEGVNSSSIISESNSPRVASPILNSDLESSLMLDIEPDLEQDVDTIALRTRSKLPLNDTPLQSIEATLVAPDITTDMYDSECDDEDWKDFLKEFVLPPPIVSTDVPADDPADDDVEDPEYNFLAEPEELDEEDLRDDRAVKISRKELNELIEEILETAESELADYEEDDDVFVSSSDQGVESAEMALSMTSSVVSDASESVEDSESSVQPEELFDSDRREQLDEQLRKHVQLMAQGFVLTASVPELKTTNEDYKLLLIELQGFGLKNTMMSGKKSAFDAWNLTSAVELVTKFVDNPEEVDPNTSSRKIRKIRGKGLTTKAVDVLSQSRIFIYPKLMVQRAVQLGDKSKLSFTQAEDNLIALGLAEFEPLNLPIEDISGGLSLMQLISQNMLPCKTGNQIRCRIKRLKKLMQTEFNAVTFFAMHKKLPPISRVPAAKFDAANVPKPIDQLLELLPEWLKEMVNEMATVLTPTKRVVPKYIIPSSVQYRILKPLPTSSNSRPMYVVTQPLPLRPVPSPGKIFIATNIQKKATVNQSGVACKSPDSARLLSPEGGVSFSTHSTESTHSVVYVPSGARNKATTVSMVKLQSPTGSVVSPVITVAKPVMTTPEKRSESPVLGRVAPQAFGPTAVLKRIISPMKQVSPILKKYSPSSMRRTGGNLPKILPKVVRPTVVMTPVQLFPSSPSKNSSPSKSSVRRRLEPKPSPPDSDSLKTSSAVQQQECEMSPSKLSAQEVNDNEKNENEETTTIENITEDAVESLESVTIDACNSENLPAAESTTTFSPAQVEVDSQSDPELFEDEEEQLDSAEHLAALMAASSTIKSTPRGRPHNTIARKSTRQRDMESTLQLLAPDLLESDPLKEDREAALVQLYMTKVKEVTKNNPETYEEFLKLLYEFGQSNRLATQLYADVCKLFRDHPVLCEEFVAFLLPEQAMECGKLTEYLQLNKMRTFFRKVEVHFQKHPQHILKVTKALMQCQQSSDVTVSHIKSVIQPLLRGQTHLMEEFLQLFPEEKVPESYMTDYEEVTLPDSDVEVDDDGFEHVTLPDEENEYGGKKCKCQCHDVQDPKFLNRVRHCASCYTKIIDGRIYIQSGKSLKPAQVVYLNPEDREYVLAQQRKTAESSKPAPLLLSPTDNNANVQPEVEVAVVDVTGPHSPNSQCSESSSVSSLSPTGLKDSDEEKEANNGERGMPHPLLAAMENISPEATNHMPLPSGGVTEDAILTPDTSSNNSSGGPQDFSMLRLVIRRSKTDGDLSSAVCEPAKSGTGNNVPPEQRKVQQATNEAATALSPSVSTNQRTEMPSETVVTSAPPECSPSLLFTLAASTLADAVHDVDVTGPVAGDMSRKQTEKLSKCQGKTVATDSPAQSDFVTPTKRRHRAEKRDTVPDPLKVTPGKAETCSPSSHLKSVTQSPGLSAQNHSVDEHGEVVVLWTREADRLILTTCQKLGAMENVFESLAKQLKNKSAVEVRQRFEELMQLLHHYKQGDT